MPRIDGERWRRLAPHLDEALGLTAEQRGPWLRAISDRDPELAAELQTMLEEHGSLEEKGFLAGPNLATLLPASVGGLRDPARDGSGEPAAGRGDARARFAVGERLAGRYQVVRFIARGGMGEVY